MPIFNMWPADKISAYIAGSQRIDEYYKMSEKVSGRVDPKIIMARSRMVREAFHGNNMADMARDIGVSHDTWSNAESKGVLSKTNAIRLERAKGVNVRWLWGLDDALPAVLVGRTSGLPRPIEGARKPRSGKGGRPQKQRP